MKRNLFISVILSICTFSTCFALDISEIDSNFKSEKIGNTELVFLNALKAPFVIEGLPWHKEGEPLRRVPNTITKENTNGGVMGLANHTSGVAIRFSTNSANLAIRYVNWASSDMRHMPRTGSCGIDVYKRSEDGKYTFVKNVTSSIFQNGKDKTPTVELVVRGAKGFREYVLFLPRYSGIESLEVGVSKDAKFTKPSPHKTKKPILFYGSSITQGGCSSRPATVYSGILCRRFDAEEINLGFSGSAKGEPILAQIIGDLDLSIFVYDYDYNAPTAEHLEKTHEPFFKEFRKKQPNTPVIMMSRVSHFTDKRTSIIKKTYENAVNAGDKNVYFIDGSKIFNACGGFTEATVDACHPTDLGFYYMYKALEPIVEEILKK